MVSSLANCLVGQNFCFHNSFSLGFGLYPSFLRGVFFNATMLQK